MRSDPDKRLQDRHAIRLKPHLDKDDQHAQDAQDTPDAQSDPGGQNDRVVPTLGDATAVPVNRVYVPEKFRLSITQRPAAINRGIRSWRSRKNALFAKLTLVLIALTLLVYYIASSGL